jgi:hypothetical protein
VISRPRKPAECQIPTIAYLDCFRDQRRHVPRRLIDAGLHGIPGAGAEKLNLGPFDLEISHHRQGLKATTAGQQREISSCAPSPTFSPSSTQAP